MVCRDEIFKALENWPTPIVFSDWQYGRDCFAGRAVAEMEGRVIDELICRKPKHGVKQSKHRHFLRGL